MSSREEEIRAGAAAQVGLNRTRDSIKQHSVGWEKYGRDDTLTSAHLTALKDYDKKDPSVQKAALDDHSTGALIAEALTLMLKASSSSVEDLQYVLMLIHEMLEGEGRKRVALFRELKTVDPFQKLLDLCAWQRDATIVRLATHNLAVLHYPGLGAGRPITNKSLKELAEFVRDSLDHDKLKDGKAAIDKMIDMASCLMVFLREAECRTFVNDQFHLHRHLSGFLDHALKVGNVQLLYQIVFCLWLLSYDEEIAVQMDTTDVVVNMLKVMKSVSKEKVIRVCLACLRNLVDKAGHNQTMIDNAAVKQLAVLRNRKWSDDEVREDLDFISDALAKSVHVLSSLDMYRKEIAEGKLEWTPVHKSEMFWRDNVVKICPVGKGVVDSEDLLALISLLNVKMDKAKTDKLDDEDVTTVAVICHDLGEFARFHPQGKKILTGDAAMHADKRSTKDLLMSIMSNPPGGNEEIGKQALTCIHKMMVTNWQFLESR